MIPNIYSRASFRHNIAKRLAASLETSNNNATRENAMTDSAQIETSARTEIEAELFRKLISHLQKYPEVQNIELMNLAYFCRNCFSKWYMSAAQSRGIDLDYDQAREIIYGMPIEEYKSAYQGKATAEQLEQFGESQDKATE